MLQYLTYQHNVQRFFREHSEKYNGIIIPLSIATSFPSGTLGFIRALCSKHNSIEYAIDPRNALFQKKWNRSKNIRPPHEKMAAAFGEPYTTEGTIRALLPSDFSDEILRQHVQDCIQLQKNFRISSEDERKLKKYKDMLGLDVMDPLSEPQHLIPPYFEFSNSSDKWFDISMNAIEIAIEYSENIPIRPVFHFGSWEDNSDLPTVFTPLNELGIEGIWLYPNYFKEHDSSVSELKIYKAVIEESQALKIDPYALFGGYFSILLSYFGLMGFSNGVGYGEWRDSGYHKGGSAIKRIYLLKLHRYVDATNAQLLINSDSEYFGYDTEIIGSYVDSGNSVINMTNQEALDHFMECRNQELNFVQTRSKEEAVNELATTVSKLKDIGPLESERFGDSLERWIQAVS